MLGSNLPEGLPHPTLRSSHCLFEANNHSAQDAPGPLLKGLLYAPYCDKE
jgi:hypothetical protein